MPLPKGTRYRIKTYKSGKRVRLAFFRGEVIETKALGGRPTKSRKRLNRKRRRIGI